MNEINELPLHQKEQLAKGKLFFLSHSIHSMRKLNFTIDHGPVRS